MAVVHAVDHEREPLDGGLPARHDAGIKDNRSSGVLRQLTFDRPGLLADQLQRPGNAPSRPDAPLRSARLQLAQLRSADRLQKRLMLGVDRKSSAYRQNDVNDPKQTF